MSDADKPKSPAQPKVRDVGPPRPKEPPRPTQKLPAASLDFDPDELIDTAFEALEGPSRTEEQRPPSASEARDPEHPSGQAEEDVASQVERDPEPTRALGTISAFPEHEPPTHGGFRKSERFDLTAIDETRPEELIPTDGPPADDTAPTVELDFEGDFADAEDIAFAEDLAEKWRD